MKGQYHAGGALRATQRQRAHAPQSTPSRYIPSGGAALKGLTAVGIAGAGLYGLYGIYRSRQAGPCDPHDYRAVGKCDWLDYGKGIAKTPLESLTKEQASKLCGFLNGEEGKEITESFRRNGKMATFTLQDPQKGNMHIFSTEEAKSRIIARTEKDQTENTVQVINPKEAAEWLPKYYGAHGAPKITVFAPGKGTLDHTQAAMLMVLQNSNAKRVQSFVFEGDTWRESRMHRQPFNEKSFVYQHAAGDDYTQGVVTVFIEFSEIEKRLATYRAIVPSTDPKKPSTYVPLTEKQSELLRFFLHDPRLLQDSISLDGEHWGLIQRVLHGPAQHDLFIWAEGDSKTTIRKPVKGEIIVCFRGECTAVKNDTAAITEEVDTTVNGTQVRGAKALPVCAAMALTFNEARLSGATQHMADARVEALSDEKGNWLDTPATCKARTRRGLTCIYTTTGGALEQEILFVQLRKQAQAAPAAPRAAPTANDGAWSELENQRPQPSTPLAPGPPQPMSGGTGWFKDLFGFLDGTHATFDASSQKFTYDPEGGTLRVAGKDTTWQAGYFSTPSLALLRDVTKRQLEALKQSGTKTTVRIVTGDVAAMHGDPDYKGALFQAASQFNCLEFATKTNVPEDGVAVYYSDPTQGPACAISCAPGTIVRNYFAHDGTEPQRSKTTDTQINTLRELIGALQGDALVAVKNGYTESTAENLETLNARIMRLSPGDREKTLGELRVGVQLDTEVTCTKVNGQAGWHRVDPNAKIIVTQVYASALSVAYSSAGEERAAARFTRETGKSYTADFAQLSDDERTLYRTLYKNILRETNQGLWEPLARLVLEAAYEATLHAALLAGTRTVVLTAIGGGVFGNKNEWISDAAVKALTVFADAGLDVVINEYTKDALKYIQNALLQTQTTSGLLGQAFGRGPRVRRLAHSARAVSLYTE